MPSINPIAMYLSVFQVSKCQKYAKWKAAYIHQCLQTGQTPIPGPLTDEGDEENAPQPPDMSEYGCHSV